MHLQESGEMYLETIYVLSKQLNAVRSIDVGEHMGYSKPSVSRAIGLLKNGGYIIVDEEGHIHLTDLGLEITSKINERHRVISELLMKIGVDRKTAEEDACKMEHAISDTSFEALKNYLSNI